jgi:predicted secreted hydrolase
MRNLFLISLMLVQSVFAAPFEKALPGKKFEFPKDDFEHTNFKTEWWYFTGNLQDETGKQFGYQLTFFRNAMGDQIHAASRKSLWASDQLVMAHFAVTDVDNKIHQSYEKIRRNLPQVAGFSKDPWSIHIQPWSIVYISEGKYQLTAAQDELKLNITCSQSKPRVFQGDHGYSRKGKDVGNASYYLSFTRMKTEGTLQIQNKTYRVLGESWMDHEISTSALDENQAGWDWFAIQFEGGEELMIYQLRDQDGKQGEFSSGTWIDAKGLSRTLSFKDFTLQPQRFWKSKRTKTSYPVQWNVIVPSLNLNLNVSAKVENQEMNTSIPYWEGTIDVSGSHKGQGYLELTGYGETLSLFLGGKK